MTKVCLYCGKDFSPSNNIQKYCLECKHLSHHQSLAGGMKICIVCGHEFPTKHKGHKTCSDACRKERNRYTRQCYLDKNPDARVRYRSAARERDRKYAKLKAEQNPIKPKVCPNCGITFTPDIFHPHKIFHDNVCQRQYSHKKERQKRTELERLIREEGGKLKKYPNPRNIKPVIKICEYCNEPFITTRKHQHFHPDCNRKFQTQKRNAIKNNINSVSYTRKSIFQRDKYTCYLCGKPLNMDAQACDPDSPTIDHIIPISKGGDDIPNNIKSAHYLCNIQKSNKDILIGGQLMFLALSRIAGVARISTKYPNVENPG